AFGLTPGEAPATALRRAARSFLAFVVDDETLRNFRLIVAEAERAPEIGKTFYEIGPQRGLERTAAFLTSLEQAGLLDLQGDALGAAHDFLGLIQHRYFKGRVCNAVAPPTPAEIDAESERAVRTFLRAYGAGR